VNPVVRNVLAVIAGIVLGSIVNMSIVTLGGAVVAPPPGADLTTTEGLRGSMHLLELRHFVFPFLAHALGTLAGAWAAASIGASARQTLALIVGCVFLAGGVAAALMLPAPLWFEALDVIVAYLPMAWLGARLAPVRSAPSAVTPV